MNRRAFFAALLAAPAVKLLPAAAPIRPIPIVPDALAYFTRCDHSGLTIRMIHAYDSTAHRFIVRCDAVSSFRYVNCNPDLCLSELKADHA